MTEVHRSSSRFEETDFEVAAEVETNLRILKPSRRKLRDGDLFAMELPDNRYLFGRVINTEARIGPMQGVILIYIYRPHFDSKTPPVSSELSRESLLVSPIMTNRLPWSRGYFETVDHWPLETRDVLSQHCFLRSDGRYYDEDNHRLARPVEPIGDYGLHSFRTIDDQVSDALGIPLIPD
jgi:hypothetical protein